MMQIASDAKAQRHTTGKRAAGERSRYAGACVTAVHNLLTNNKFIMV